jgi:Family of unknown function (DUF5524)
MQPRQEAVKAPRPSQIPGLGDQSYDDNGGPPYAANIRDTDSDYIKLAKRGGRSDLLHDEPRLEPMGNQNSASRRPNPMHKRADWYYHEDPQQNGKSAAPSKSTFGGPTSV